MRMNQTEAADASRHIRLKVKKVANRSNGTSAVTISSERGRSATAALGLCKFCSLLLKIGSEEKNEKNEAMRAAAALVFLELTIL